MGMPYLGLWGGGGNRPCAAEVPLARQPHPSRPCLLLGPGLDTGLEPERGGAGRV